MKAIPIINENSFMNSKTILTNLNIYAQSSLWKHRERKSFYILRAIRARTLLFFPPSRQCNIVPENRRENKEVLKINRNFSLAFTWDPLCQRAEKKTLTIIEAYEAVITMSLKKHYWDDEEPTKRLRWDGLELMEARRRKKVLKGR